MIYDYVKYGGHLLDKGGPFCCVRTDMRMWHCAYELVMFYQTNAGNIRLISKVRLLFNV